MEKKPIVINYNDKQDSVWITVNRETTPNLFEARVKHIMQALNMNREDAEKFCDERANWKIKLILLLDEGTVYAVENETLYSEDCHNRSPYSGRPIEISYEPTDIMTGGEEEEEDDCPTFEQVKARMDKAYSNYLEAYEPFEAEQDGEYRTTPADKEKLEQADQKLYDLCHRVLSNALFVLNNETGDFNEDEFVYTIPDDVRDNPRLKTREGYIRKVATLPTDGIVWLVNEKGEEFNDDEKLESWELYCVAKVLYALTEPVFYID